MSLKLQFKKIKESWLLVLILVALVLASNFNFVPGFNVMQKDFAMESSIARGYPVYDEGFAPEIEERIIIKTASLSTEVPRGAFKESESKLKNIVESSNSFILNENIYKNEDQGRPYFIGNYNLKVELSKYDSVVSQLREIEKVQSFSENQEDVTGRYVDLEEELELENERLQRYQVMYNNAEISDKIQLSDKIFEQERRIKYLEEAIENIDERIQYTNIYVTLTEKKSEYFGTTIVKLSDLVKSIVNSFNTLLRLVFYIIPWTVVIYVIVLISRRFRK